MKLSNMNKKAGVQISKLFLYILYVILSALFIICLQIFFSQFRSIYTTVPPGLEDQLALEYAMKSPECFMYQDEYTGHYHLLNLDHRKFTYTHFNQCFHSSIYQIRLRVQGTYIQNNAQQEITTEQFKPERFAEIVELYPDTQYNMVHNNSFHAINMSIEVQS